MTFGIHPAQVGFLEALSRGEKILYHSAMRWLTCFAPKFDANREAYTHGWVFPGMHELIYPLHDLDHGIVGVKLCELQGLLTHTDLLKTLGPDDSLSPLEVFEYGIRWVAEHGTEYHTRMARRKEEIVAKDELARAFFTSYPLRIQRDVWQLALPKSTS